MKISQPGQKNLSLHLGIRIILLLLQVNQLEDAVLELLATYDDCTSFSDAIQWVGSRYQPSDQVVLFLCMRRGFWISLFIMSVLDECDEWQVTDFKKLLEDEAARLKAASQSASQSNPLYRQFKEAVWVCPFCLALSILILFKLEFTKEHEVILISLILLELYVAYTLYG